MLLASGGSPTLGADCAAAVAASAAEIRTVEESRAAERVPRIKQDIVISQCQSLVCNGRASADASLNESIVPGSGGGKPLERKGARALERCADVLERFRKYSIKGQDHELDRAARTAARHRR